MEAKPVILCIDDKSENLKIRTLMLELFGCVTISASDHISALRAVSRQHVDLLLIDYHLADGATGDEIARDVRVICPEVPIIMLTGDPAVPQSARETVSAVLVKGASDPKTLLETIQSLLPEAKIRPRREMLFDDGNSKAS